jgi:septum formation protein
LPSAVSSIFASAQQQLRWSDDCVFAERVGRVNPSIPLVCGVSACHCPEIIMLQNPDPRLVLASTSIVRQALLANAGLTFLAETAAIDEAEIKRSARASGESAEQAALALAGLKAQRVATRASNAVVIGADQILVCDDEWYDKPEDPEAARRQLLALRGRTHLLATAVVCQRGDQLLWHHIAQPCLTMRPFPDGFLDDYLAAEGDRVLSSVGAYRLEGLGIHLFDRIEGEYTAILGLPLLPLLGFLRQHGVLR